MTRGKLYYGWTNLALAAVAMVATLPGRTQGLGLVTEPLMADLHIDRVAYAGINLWATLIGAAFCIPCGRLLDRFGSRRVLTFVLLALGVTVLTMSASTGLVTLAIAVTLTRGFGQSALSVASLALVGKWFARRLNYAMGIYSVLVGIGFIAAFPSVGQAVLSFGWRNAWFAVGLVQVALIAPLAWFLVRDRADGGEVERGSDDIADGDRLEDLTLREAVQAPAFWLFALSSSLFGLVYSGISLFNQSILEERGFDASTYHEVLVISTLVGLLANFGGGLLASVWSIQRVMGVGMAVLAGALLALPSVASHAHVVLYGMAMGIAGGVVTVVGGVLGLAARRPLAGLPIGTLSGIGGALAYYAFAVLIDDGPYGAAIPIAWAVMWLVIAVLEGRWLRAPVRRSWAEIVARGAAAAVSSGVAFYLVMGTLWGAPPPDGRNYAIQFVAWAFAWAPGLLALSVGKATDRRNVGM